MKTEKGNYPNIRKCAKRNIFYITIQFLTVLALLGLIALLATSCVSQKRVDKICQTCKPDSVIIKTDSVYIETIDTVYRISAWDSILLVSSLDPEKIIDTIYIEDEHWKGQFFISQNHFKAQISHLSDSITQIVKTKATNVNTVSEKIIKVPVDVITPKYNKWHYFLLIWFIISVVLIGVVAWMKIKGFGK